MKQKIVIKVYMDARSHSKALRIAAGASGVVSVGLTGERKDQVEVVGEGIDPVELVRLLRKKVACAEVISVGQVPPPPPPPRQRAPSPPHCPHYHVCEVIGEPRYDPVCSIM